MPPSRRLRTAPDHAPPGGQHRGPASSGEEEFFARLEQAGVAVRKRFSTRNLGQVTGYAVALPTDTAGSGGPVWYSGGKLAPDLTLPELRHRSNGQTTVPAEGPPAPLTSAERAAIWEHVTRTAAAAAEQIRQLSVTDPGLAADAAWAAANTFHAVASALGSRVLRHAADSYARAARAPYGRVPHRTPAGDGLRRAARLLALATPAPGDPVLAQIVLIVRLIALARAVAICGRRSVTRRRPLPPAAAERLHTARCAYGRRPAPSSLGGGHKPPRPGTPSPSPSAMSWSAKRRRTPAHPHLRAGHPRPRRRRASAVPPDGRPRAPSRGIIRVYAENFLRIRRTLVS